MSTTTSGTLVVPGAMLYYETRGSGPLLLILQDGDGESWKSPAGMTAMSFARPALQKNCATC